MSDHAPLTNEEGDERCRNCGNVWPCRARFREERNQTQAILNDLIEYLSYQWKHSDYNDWYVEVALKETEKKLKELQ